MTEQELPSPHAMSPRRRWADVVAAVLLGLAGVAAAWSGYQASTWSGIQAVEFSRAQALLLESARESAAADAERAIDVMTFSSWVDAYARGDERLMAFYQERFRPEFSVAFEVWLASEPEEDPAAATPFALAEYNQARLEAAEDLEGRAQAAFERGRSANQVGDRHVLNVVLLATVLFLAGVAQQARILGLEVGLLALAFMIFAFALYAMASLPTA